MLGPLKQQAEILQQRKTIGDLSSNSEAASAEIATLKQQIDLLNAKHDLLEAQQRLRDPTLS